LGITESWALEGISNAKLNLHDYSLFQKSRIFGVKKCRGGVLLYVVNFLRAELLDKNVDAGESLWVNITGRDNKVSYQPSL